MKSLQKNKRFWAAGAAVILSALVFGIAQKLPKGENIPISLNQEALAKMVKPAVVRIAQKVEGDYSLPEFDIDLNTLTTTVKLTREPKYKKLNEFITGSGFIVSQDGYILTNAHVVSKEMIKVLLLNEAFSEIFEEKLKNLSKEEQKKIFQDEEKTEKFARDALTLLLENSQFNITSSLSVLNPSSQKEKIENLFSTGFPAEIISLNEDFLFSNKDVALIKVNQAGLPTVNLGDEDQINVGSPIFVFGFPASAQLNTLNPVESTLTQGLISALKFSQSKDFKIFETDAKVSQGSSGGPMFNENGEVIGIVTYQTNPVYLALGDNFAFAVPIALGKSLMQNNRVKSETGAFSARAQAAFKLFAQNRCRLAAQEFSAAVDAANPQFVPKNYFEGYQKTCEEKILSGDSYDSQFAIVWQKIKNFSAFEWFVIIGRAILVVGSMIVLILLYQRLKKDEAEMQKLEKELEETKEGLAGQPPQSAYPQVELPLPDEETHAHVRGELGLAHPHLTNYVKEARAIGLEDGEIRAELAKAGWSEKEITQALNVI